jgi:hypothetical protein
MRTRDIKALNETIASVVDPADADRAKALQEGYLNSLTEKARQVISEAVETKNEDEVEAIMKRLAAKALKKAKKKARRSSGDDAYAGINPSAAKTDPDMKNPGRVAEELIYEVAAPGMEDWASDPKVKASFKKQYGKRWKEVMYGRSWNLAKKEKELGVNEEAELDLAEGVSAKRMRIIRKHNVSGKPIKGEVADFMQRSFKKKFYKDKVKFGGATPAVLGRARLKHSAMKAKGLAEAEQLDEAGYKKLMRLRGKAYDTGNPKIARAAAELQSKVAARMAMKGGASAEAVKGGGSLIGKSGKYTKKAGSLANQRSKAIASFRNLNIDRGVARDTGTGVVPAMANRLQGNKPKMSPEQIAKKRVSQAKMREYDANMRKGTFRTPEDPVAAAREKRPHYNYLKRTGKLKTYK